MPEEQRAGVRREQLGFVFQSDNLQPFLTAVENVSLALALDSRTDGYRRSLALLAALGLGTAAGKYPDQLSGGERQRVAVARALVHRPRLILADEPTGSLDSDNSIAVIELLAAAQSEVGATLIVITHDQSVAARLERRVVLRDGRVVGDEPSAARSGEYVGA
jgi:putative ABC transport system ATP-binding protein